MGNSFNIGPTELFGVRDADRDGSILAAGAPGQSGSGRGFKANPEELKSARIGRRVLFVRNAGRWTQQAYIKAPNADEFDQFGRRGAVGRRCTDGRRRQRR